MTDYTAPRRGRAGEESSYFTGDIIIRMRREDSDREREARAHGVRRASQLNEFLAEHDLPEPTPLITSVPPDVIEELEFAAAEGPLTPPWSLNAYWRINARAQLENVRRLAAELSGIREVEHAYPELTAGHPTVQAANNPLSGRQTYLDPAKVGIDARWIWTQPGGTGAGVAVADVEQSWNLKHEDLAAKGVVLVSGDNLGDTLPFTTDHGTGVLGVLVASDNRLGVVGIAPDAGPVSVASQFHRATNTDTHVADAIAAATAALSRGDVLLVEVERGADLPTEVDQADFIAISLAVGNGLVVVEAAGNGGKDLDAYTEQGKHIFDRNSVDFRESGAIMVGAALAGLPHKRFKSNFGNRVDCYAHGTEVVTAGGGDLTATGTPANSQYTETFGGTSAAAAIIAGAAVLVQGRHKSIHGTPLSPLDLRQMLSNRATGTKSGIPGGIGVMPNLRAIVRANLALHDPAAPAGDANAPTPPVRRRSARR